MDAAIKDAWVEDLRSGKYEQGKSVLRTETDKFCCLGVLCEIAVMNDVIPAPELTGAEYRYGDPSGDRSAAVLPGVVQDWSGLFDGLPYAPAELVNDTGDELYVDLASLNDGGMPFPQIADVINYFF